MLVLRSTHTLAIARAVSAEAHAESLRGEVEWLRCQLEQAALERIRASEPKAAPQKKADPVMDTIASVSGNDAGRRKRLGALVREWRKQGASDEQIIIDLTNWRSTDDDDAK